MIFCITCNCELYPSNPLNRDGSVIIIHALAGHILVIKEVKVMVVPTSTAENPCGFLIKTYEVIKMPYVRPLGHIGGHNPFSNTAPIIEQGKEVKSGSQ